MVQQKNPYKLLWLILKPSPFWFPASREGPRKALWLQQSHCLPEGLKKIKGKPKKKTNVYSLRGVVNAFLAPLKTSKLNQLNHWPGMNYSSWNESSGAMTKGHRLRQHCMAAVPIGYHFSPPTRLGNFNQDDSYVPAQALPFGHHNRTKQL